MQDVASTPRCLVAFVFCSQRLASLSGSTLAGRQKVAALFGNWVLSSVELYGADMHRR